MRIERQQREVILVLPASSEALIISQYCSACQCRVEIQCQQVSPISWHRHQASRQLQDPWVSVSRYCHTPAFTWPKLWGLLQCWHSLSHCDLMRPTCVETRATAHVLHRWIVILALPHEMIFLVNPSDRQEWMFVVVKCCIWDNCPLRMGFTQTSICPSQFPWTAHSMQPNLL